MMLAISVLRPISQNCSYLQKKSTGPEDALGCKVEQGTWSTKTTYNLIRVHDNHFDKYIWKWYLLPELTHLCLLNTGNHKSHPELKSPSQLLKVHLMAYFADRMDNLPTFAQFISLGARIQRWAVSCRTPTMGPSYLNILVRTDVRHQS